MIRENLPWPEDCYEVSIKIAKRPADADCESVEWRISMYNALSFIRRRLMQLEDEGLCISEIYTLDARGEYEYDPEVDDTPAGLD